MVCKVELAGGNKQAFKTLVKIYLPGCKLYIPGCKFYIL